MEEIRTAGAIAVVIIGFLGILVSDRGWMFFSKCRQAVRDTLVRTTGCILHPVSRRYRQWRYKDRIANLEPASYDEYRQLPDADERLFSEFKPEAWHKIMREQFVSSVQRFEESKRDWDLKESSRREQIIPAGPLVKIGDNAEIICGNCAFFAASFDGDTAEELKISTAEGVCHKDPAPQEVYPFSVCSHHSALQGFAPSTNGFYVFAPAKSQETPR